MIWLNNFILSFSDNIEVKEYQMQTIKRLGNILRNQEIDIQV